MFVGKIREFFINFGRAFQSRNYRLFFIGQLVSCTGSQIQAVAMGWLVYDLTNSKTMLGTILLLSQAPGLILSPVAGILMSRFNKRRLLMIVLVLSSLHAVILAVLTLTGVITPALLLVMAAFMGILTSLEMPTRHSLIYFMVKEPSHLGNAIALNSMIFNLGRLVGPAIGGFAISLIKDNWGTALSQGNLPSDVPSHIGESFCFFLNSLSYFAAVIALHLMDFVLPVYERGKNAAHDFWEGLKTAWTFPPVRVVLLTLSMIGATAITANTLTPAIARDILHGDSRFLGMLQSSLALGAIISAGYMASRSTLKYFNYHFIVATLSSGTGLMIYSYSSSLKLSCFAMFLMGLGQILLFSSTNTLIQLIAPHKYRDRFISFYAAILLGVVPLGCQFTGFLADHIGLREAVRICGICSFLVMIWYLFNRHHRRDHEYPATE